MRKGNALSAVLIGGHLSDYLRSDIAGRGKAVRLFYHGAGYYGAVIEHILKVYKVAVVHMLGKIIRIVKMDYTLLVSLHYFLRQQNAVCDILADLARHIIALHAVYGGVFIGVFLLYLFVVAFDKA